MIDVNFRFYRGEFFILGVKRGTVSSSTSLDNIIERGTYDITNAIDNPYGTGYSAEMFVDYQSANFVMQRAFRKGFPDKTRWKWDGSWTSWVDNYDSSMLTNQTLLSSLATALGAGMRVKGSVTGLGDFNLVVENGYYTCNPQSMANRPSTPSTQASLWVCGGGGTSSLVLQILWDNVNSTQYGKVFMRTRYNDTTWQDWVVMSTDYPLFYKNYNSLESLKTAIVNFDNLYNVDLNTIGTNNEYYASTSSPATNHFPESSTGGYFTSRSKQVTSSVVFIWQTFFSTGGSFFTRFGRIDDGVYSFEVWKEL